MCFRLCRDVLWFCRDVLWFQHQRLMWCLCLQDLQRNFNVHCETLWCPRQLKQFSPPPLSLDVVGDPPLCDIILKSFSSLVLYWDYWSSCEILTEVCNQNYSTSPSLNTVLLYYMITTKLTGSKKQVLPIKINAHDSKIDFAPKTTRIYYQISLSSSLSGLFLLTVFPKHSDKILYTG